MAELEQRLVETLDEAEADASTTKTRVVQAREPCHLLGVTCSLYKPKRQSRQVANAMMSIYTLREALVRRAQ